MKCLIICMSLITALSAFPFNKNDKNYRLDATIIPIHYDIEITPYFDDGNEFGKMLNTFDGIVAINLMPTLPNTQQLRLHTLNLKITKMSIIMAGEEESTREIVTSTEYDSETEIITLNLNSQLIENFSYILTLEYSAEMEIDNPGFYSGWFVENSKNITYGGTHSQPVYARKIFPCFDEPAFKATFQIIINKPHDYDAFSNTEVLSIENIPDRTTYNRITFKQTPLMSTYLVAFAIGPFQQNTNAAKSFSIITRKDLLSASAYALTMGQTVLENLGNYLNTGYYDAMTKLDIIALPDFGGSAMENWGLIITREDLLLYNVMYTSLYNQQKIVYILAHEIAHQWFGNLVTCDWWSYTWLNEAFATYFQFFTSANIQPDWELEKQFVIEILQPAMLVDSNINSQPLTRTVQTQIESIASFEKISYNKGAAFLRMLQHMIGETKFRDGLVRYLKKHKYSSTVPQNLIDELIDPDDVEYPDFEDFFNSWTTQSNYPLITVVYNSETQQVVVTQKPFVLDSMNSPSDKLWHIPLTFATNVDDFSNANVKEIMKTKSLTIPIDTQNSWIIFNLNQVGFYRVNYDFNNWETIRKALFSENHGGIPEVNRAQIVDDLFNLALANEISYEFAFSILEYLKTETHYLPWNAALTSFSYLLAKMDQHQLDDFSGYILKLLNKSFETVGWINFMDDDRLEVYHRAQVLQWICKFGHANSVLWSKNLFAIYKDDNSQIIPVDIRSVVFCSAMRNGDIYDLVFLWSRFNNENNPNEQIILLQAMGCTNKKEFLYLALDLILTEFVRDQNRPYIIAQTYSQTEGNVQHVLDYFIEKHDTIIQGFKGQSALVISTLVALSTKFIRQSQVEQMEQFYQDHKLTYEEFETSISNAAANARKNIEWNQAHIPKIVQVIRKNFRLDQNFIPKHYELEIIPYLDRTNEFNKEPFTFDGNIKIHVLPTDSESTTLRIHLNELNIRKMSITNEDSSFSDISIISRMHDEETEITTIVFDKELENGKVYILSIEYSALIRDDMKGFYRSKYIENGDERILFTTQLKPTLARHVFPCFDEPRFKATFSLAIIKPIEYTVYSNTMPVGDKEDYSETYDKVTFKQTPIMSTYLLNFAITKFQIRPNSPNAKIQVIARPDQYNHSSYALQNGWNMLTMMGNYLNYDYFDVSTSDGNVEKIQMIGLPEYMNDATAHWGLLSYRETNLLYAKEFASLKDKQQMAMMMTREVAHLWFGNLVTCNWWNYAWLNEAFGNFFQYHLTALAEPMWELDKQYVVDMVQPGLLFDSETNAHPLNADVTTSLETAENYDMIMYNKGGSLLRMVQHLIGNTKFVTALRTFVKKYEYQTVISENLLNEFHEIGKDEYQSLYDIIEPWTTQSNYPLIYVRYDTVAKSVTVTQKVFLLQNVVTVPNKLWPIPLSYTTNGKGFTNTKPQHIMYDKSMSFTLDTYGSWIIFNMQQTGFYRVNYDSNNWELIKTALFSENHDGIHEVNRAQIVDDLFNLARAREISYELLFSMIDYLQTETHYLPWVAAFNGFEFIAIRMGSGFNEFRLYLKKLLSESLISTGMKEAATDSQLTIYHRKNILKWVCKLDIDYNWQSEAWEILNKYKEDESKLIPVNIREDAYCCAMRSAAANITYFDFLWDKYEKQTILTEQLAILRGLTCARSADILNQLIVKILSPSVRYQDKLPMFINIFMENSENVDFIIDYLTKNFKDIFSGFNNDLKMIDAIFKSLTSQISIFKQGSNLEELILINYDIIGEISDSLFDYILESDNNLLWTLRNVPNILSQIEKNLYGTTTEIETTESSETTTGKDDDGDDDDASVFHKSNMLVIAVLTIALFLL